MSLTFYHKMMKFSKTDIATMTTTIVSLILKHLTLNVTCIWTFPFGSNGTHPQSIHSSSHQSIHYHFLGFSFFLVTTRLTKLFLELDGYFHISTSCSFGVAVAQKLEQVIYKSEGQWFNAPIKESLGKLLCDAFIGMCMNVVKSALTSPLIVFSGLATFATLPRIHTRQPRGRCLHSSSPYLLA